MKRTSVIAVIVGLCLIIVGTFCSEMIISELMKNEGVAEFVVNRMIRNTEFSVQLFGSVTVFCALIGWIFHKKTAKWCGLKTTAAAWGISAVTGLGIHCVLSLLSCSLDSNPARHPIRYPYSLCIGTICFLAFCALVYLYFKLQKKNLSILGILMDVGLGLVYCVPFIFVWATVDSILDNLLT